MRRGRRVRIFDIEAAYLNSKLNETIYVLPEPGLLDAPDGYVFPLLLPLYGLRQAGRCFYDTYSDVFEKFGAKSFLKEPGVWRCVKGDRSFICVAFVDDWIFDGDDTLIEEFIKFAGSTFTIKETPIANDKTFLLLGMELKYTVVQSRLQLKITADRIAKTLLEKYKVQYPKDVSAPGHKLHQQLASDDRSKPLTREGTTRYQSAVGALMFLSSTCRPDLAHSAGALAIKMGQPTNNASKALDHTLNYLSFTISAINRKYDLIFRQVENVSFPDFRNKQNVKLISYVDANHQSPRSTSGYVFIWDGCLIDWSSKRQRLTQLSSTGAEWDALAHCTANALYMRDFMAFIGYNMSNSIKTAEDNTGVLRWAQELYRGQFSRRKHIDLRTFFINDAVRYKIIKVLPVSTSYQYADPMTKSLDYKSHENMFKKLLNFGQDCVIQVSDPLLIT